MKETIKRNWTKEESEKSIDKKGIKRKKEQGMIQSQSMKISGEEEDEWEERKRTEKKKNKY